MTRRRMAPTLVLMLCGCASGERTERTASDSAAPQVATAQHTRSDFQALRYVEGDWRGSGYQGGPFYETYRFVNDSTIEMIGWTDSTLTKQQEQSHYQLRDGVIGTDKGARLVKADSTGHHFQATSYAWTFTPVSADRWTARVGPSTLYTMDRIKR